MVAIVLALLVIGIALCLGGCSSANRYKVDLDGADFCYEGVKKSYRAGEEVTLYYTLIATDTDYSFALDGESINFDYDDRKGFVIQFTMPEHDVTLTCNSQSSMTYVPFTWELESDVMLIDYYYATSATEDGDAYHELVFTTTEDPMQVRVDEYLKEEGGEETCSTVYIDYSFAEIILDYIDIYGMYAWNELEDAHSLDGVLKVCEFWYGGQHIRVSSEHMPEDGEETLDSLYEMLQAYASWVD